MEQRASLQCRGKSYYGRRIRRDYRRAVYRIRTIKRQTEEKEAAVKEAVEGVREAAKDQGDKDK